MRIQATRTRTLIGRGEDICEATRKRSIAYVVHGLVYQNQSETRGETPHSGEAQHGRSLRPAILKPKSKMVSFGYDSMGSAGSYCEMAMVSREL